MTDLPHFSQPFRFQRDALGAMSAAVTEQDTPDEIADCVEVTIRTAQGDRATLPEFGRPDTLEFALDRELAQAQLEQALNDAEPRADELVRAGDVDPNDPGVLRLRAMFGLVEGSTSEL